MSALTCGKWGESIALKFLLAKGYTFVTSNYRSRFGEVDLIVKGGSYFIFVEVKTRKSSAFALGREFVGKQKQRKIVATANYWLSNYSTSLQPRFDVVEIYAPYGQDTKKPEIIHIKNAFGV